MGCHCLLHSNLVKMEYITDYRGRLKNLPITSLNMLNVQEIGHMRLSGHFSVPQVCLRIQRHSCRINLKHILPENTDLKKKFFKACSLQIQISWGLLPGMPMVFGRSLHEMHHSGSSWEACSYDSPGCPLKLLLLLQGYQMMGTLLCLQEGEKPGRVA